MKTLKFVLIAAFVSFAMMSFSTTILDVDKPDKKVHIENAMMSKGLLDAMDLQISEDLIKVERHGLYYVKIRFRGSFITIYGDLKAFQKYFRARKWVSEKPLTGDKLTY